MSISRRFFIQSLGAVVLASRFGFSGDVFAAAGAEGGAAALWEPVKSMGRANWIWSGDATLANAWVSFRRGFSLAAKPGTASVQVACADKYWLWINGVLVRREGGLKSGPTRRDWYVDEWDVAPHLRAGENQIAVLAWSFGRPGASHRNSGKGGLLLRLATQDIEIVTDNRWLARRHPAFGQRGDGVSVTLCEQAVDFDARKDMPGWTDAKFDDSAWDAARELGAAGGAPWGELVSRPIPFWMDAEPKACEVDTALPITGPAVVVGRFRENIQVYPIIKVRAQAGAEITLQIERDKKTTRYVTREGEQEFEVQAWGNGHFVTCRIPAGVTLLGFSYRETSYAADFTGAYACSDPDFNRLWTKAAITARLCMRDTFMDCPDRERSAWPGDAANIIEVTLRALDRRSDAMIGKTLKELAAWASPGGNLWGAVPTSRFPDSFREFPAQTLLMIGFGLKSAWLHGGDRELLATLYPSIRRYVLELFRVESGLMVHRGPWATAWGPGVQSWYDWGEGVDAKLLDQGLYYSALGMLETAARELGREDDRARCAALRAEMRAAFDAAYWSDTDKAYRSTGYKWALDDRGQALAVVSGLAPESRHAMLADVLERVHGSSIYMERFALEALVMAGRPRSALSRLYRRFSEEIRSDYSTLPEKFGEKSNHAWGGAAIVLLAERLAGISIAKPGARSFVFAPVADGLASATHRLTTAHGPLILAYKIGPSEAEYRLDIPAGVEVDATCVYDKWMRINGASVAPGESRHALGAGKWRVEMRA